MQVPSPFGPIEPCVLVSSHRLSLNPHVILGTPRFLRPNIALYFVRLSHPTLLGEGYHVNHRGMLCDLTVREHWGETWYFVQGYDDGNHLQPIAILMTLISLYRVWSEYKVGRTFKF